MPTLTYKVAGQEVKLADKDYLSEGGEGKIYKKGKVAYKIYHTPTRMLPFAKIAELQAIKSSHVIKPGDIIYEKAGAVGYTMPFLDNTEALAKIFTNSFINRNNLQYNRLVDLVKRLKERIREVHAGRCLVVDLNEFNFLIGNNLSEIYAIDADSYQTPSFPATAIMESIRDRHNKHFTELTDWFSWGIIAFQMLTGIHPYKGTVPGFEKCAKEQILNERMLANKSVLNSRAKMPPSVRDLNSIPRNLKSWFVHQFENGERNPPPDNFDQTIAPTRKTTFSKSKLNLILIKKFHENITNMFFIAGRSYLFTNTQVFIDLVHHSKSGIDANLIVDGYEYQRDADKVYLLDKIGHIKTKTLVANLLDLPNSTIPIKNGIIQNLCGSYYFYRLDGKACQQIRLKDMEGVYNKIVYGKYERGVLVVLALNNITKEYDLLIYSIKDQGADLDIIRGVSQDIAFAATSAGVCILKISDDVFIFHRTDIFNKKNILDANLDIDELYSDGIKVYGVKGDSLWQVSNA